MAAGVSDGVREEAIAGRRFARWWDRGYRGWVNEVESRILEVLAEMERGLAAMKTGGPAPGLVALFGQLDRLAVALPPDARALRHYLERRSYGKALRYLENGDEDAAVDPV
jgi:hypothetical protein